MKYVIVDDEKIILRGIERTIREVIDQNDQIFACNTVAEAIKVVKEQQPYVLFSDIDMPSMNGLELSKEIHSVSPKTHIVFITGHPTYSLSAWQTAAEGFLLKPATSEDIKKILNKIKEHETPLIEELLPTEMEKLFNKKIPLNWDGGKTIDNINIDIICFGNFEIYYRKKPLHFTRKKSKECLPIW